jgi:hypothetical protein
MNSKVKQTNKTNLIVLMRQNLGLQCPLAGSPSPLYRWPSPRVLIGCHTNSLDMSIYIIVSIFDFIVLRLTHCQAYPVFYAEDK